MLSIHIVNQIFSYLCSPIQTAVQIGNDANGLS